MSLDNLSESRKRYAAFLILVILGFIIYSNTIQAPFVFDDHESIEENPLLRSLSNFSNLSGARYVVNLTFAVNYAIGGLNTSGFHLVNIAIHVINAVLVYLLVAVTFRAPLLRPMAEGRELPVEGIAFTSALLFISHPVQTEAVSYLSQRYASLATLFYVLSIILYVKSRLAEEGAGKGRVWAFYISALAATVLAQKSKEIGFTLPAVILLYEFAFFGNEKGFKRRFSGLMPFLLCLAIIPLERFYSGVPPTQNGQVADKFSMMLREELSTLPRYDYLVTQFRVIVTYLRLMIFPVNQNVDYDYPVFHSLLTPQAFLSFLFLAALFLFSIYTFFSSRRTKNVYGIFISSGIIWFFVTISIESSIIPISDVIFEHRLYLPSVGLAAAFSSLFFHIADAKAGIRKPVLVLVAVIIAALSIATYKRNIVWESELSVWQDAVEKSPNKARGYNNIGYALVRIDKYNEAIPYFEKVIRLKPDFWGAYNNLGSALVQAERYSEAIGYLNRAVQLKPDYPKSYNNLGYALAQTGRSDEALVNLERAVKLKPDFAEAYSNLAFTLAQMKRTDEAIRALEVAVRLEPNSPDYHNNLANVFFMAGRIDEAITHYQKALSLKPDHQNARINLANALRLKSGDPR